MITRNQIIHCFQDAQLNAALEGKPRAKRVFRQMVKIHLGHPVDWTKAERRLVAEVAGDCHMVGTITWAFEDTKRWKQHQAEFEKYRLAMERVRNKGEWITKPTPGTHARQQTELTKYQQAMKRKLEEQGR